MNVLPFPCMLPNGFIFNIVSRNYIFPNDFDDRDQQAGIAVPYRLIKNNF